MEDGREDARAKVVVEELARTLAAGATALTYTPAEVRVTAKVEPSRTRRGSCTGI